MKLSDAYPSKWLAASDAEDGDLVLTIKDVEMEEMRSSNGGAPERKLKIEFREQGVKPMIVNKTNAGVISKLHGDDTDEWIGKRIAVYATEVQFGTEVMMGLRVRLKAPKPATASNAKPQRPGTVANDDDEDIEFDAPPAAPQRGVRPTRPATPAANSGADDDEIPF